MNDPLLATDAGPTVAPPTWSRRWVVAAALLIGAAALALHAVQLAYPLIIYDDFQVLTASESWATTCEHLWQPHNEHVMPLGRLSTWLLVQLAGRPTMVQRLASLQGPLAVVCGMFLLGLFVGRELGHPLYGLLAMAFFGVTTQYREAVYWFSASFGVLAVDTLLVALLAAQRWRQTGRRRRLAVSALAAGLAPCWFASGILAGPLCSLYLLAAVRDGEGLLSRLRTAVIPWIGTGVFLAVGLVRNVEHIMHLEHYGEKTAVEAFHPFLGLVYTGRSLVDNLVLGTIGLRAVNVPDYLIPACLLLLGVAAVVWWRLAPCRRLLVLGLGCILASYWLVYSARAEWGYFKVSSWGRYQLLPHLGLTLFIAGGLPRWQSGALRAAAAPPGRLWWTGLVLTRLLELLVLTQVPRGVHDLASYRAWHGAQYADLRRIEEVDALCRQHRIGAATAQQALPPLRVLVAGDRFNGWSWLRGSDDPRPLSSAEARALLE